MLTPNEKCKWHTYETLPPDIQAIVRQLATIYGMSAAKGGPICLLRLKPPALESLIDPILIDRLTKTHDTHITADIDNGFLLEMWFDKVGITL